MGFEVTIRCDIGKGDPLAKRSCYTFDPKRSAEIPRHEAPASRDAVYVAEHRAKGSGWKLVRKAGHPARWVCPACQ